MTNRFGNNIRVFLFILFIVSVAILILITTLRFGPSEQERIRYLKEYVSYMFANEERKSEIEECRLERCIRALKSDDPSQRRVAAQALMLRKDPSTVPALIEALSDGDAMVRSSVVYALKEIQDPAAVEHIIGVLDDEYYGVRRGAVLALGEFKEPKAIPSLIDRLVDVDEPVRSNARAVLSDLTGVRPCESSDDYAQSLKKVLRGMSGNESAEDLAEWEKCRQKWQQWWEHNKTRLQKIE